MAGTKKFLQETILIYTDYYSAHSDDYLVTLVHDLQFALDNYNNRDKKYTKKELEWAKKEGSKVGIKDPKKFLKTKITDLSSALEKRGMDLVLTFNSENTSTVKLLKDKATQLLRKELNFKAVPVKTAPSKKGKK